MRQRAEGRGQMAEDSDRRRPRRLTRGRLARGGGAAAFFRALPSALCALTVLLAPHAFGCSVCYGAPGDPLVKGANNGIMLLLGIVGFVQIGFVAMFWSFWRRARDQRRFRESLRVIEGGPRP
jgi:hypothetical protein